MLSGSLSILSSLQLKWSGCMCISKHLNVGCKAEELHSLLVILDLYAHMLQSNQVCNGTWNFFQQPLTLGEAKSEHLL